MGPTAAGKTALAVALARALDGELISVDSALVYRGLDIGAAKPGYPHHLIDICDPAEAYSAARFAVDARRAIDTVRGRGRLPILVGGTMLYYRALFEGLSPLPASDPDVRASIEAEAAQHGWPHLHAQLAAVDPQAAARIHPRHSQRLARALEVFRISGVPLSRLQERPGGGLGEPALCVAVAPRERAVLHRRIEARFTEMLAAGFLDEVAGLRERGDLHPRLPALRAVGYRQLWEHLEGRCSLDEAQQRGVAATRQLAKRQFTWLRKWPDLRWIWTDDAGKVLDHDLLRPGCDTAPQAGGADPADLLLNYLA
jgi:tRNA dimethylallyltransferase